MGKIDFDAIKRNVKRDPHPLLSGITVGDKVTYRLHESKGGKKKKKRKKKTGPSSSRRYMRGYLGAWCPWWMPYDTHHGQHDPKFDPKPPEPVPDAGGDAPSVGPADGSGAAPAMGGGDVGGMVGGGGMVGESVVSGVVLGESSDHGLFFESVDDAVGFMISSELVEVAPESMSDTKKMLVNGVAEAVSCYTPQLPKRHPFRVFKVSDVPTVRVKRFGVEAAEN